MTNTKTNTPGDRALSALIKLAFFGTAAAAGAVMALYGFRFGRTEMHMSAQAAWLTPACFIGCTLVGALELYRRPTRMLSNIIFLVVVTGVNMMIAQAHGGWAAVWIPIVLTLATVLAVREIYTGPLARVRVEGEQR